MKTGWRCFMLSCVCFSTLFFVNVFHETQDVDQHYGSNFGYSDRKKTKATQRIKYVGENLYHHQQQQQQQNVDSDTRQLHSSTASRMSQTKSASSSSPDARMRSSSAATLFDPASYNYTIANPDLCAGVSVYILFFVQSAADHFEMRARIRRTWASVEQHGPYHLRTVFMLATPTSADTQRRIRRESEAHSDVVQMGFAEHYRNLTLKHIMSLRWIATYCNHSRYVVKADDDTIVNVYRLAGFLTAEYGGAGISNHIYCSVYANISPRRDRADKWYVSRREYPHSKYPPYCEGFAYVTSPTVTSALYTAALRVPVYWIDDVYITGIVLQKLGLGHRQFRKNNGYTATGSHSCLPNTVRNSLFQLQQYSRSVAFDWDSCWRNMTIASAQSHSIRILRRKHGSSTLDESEAKAIGGVNES